VVSCVIADIVFYETGRAAAPTEILLKKKQSWNYNREIENQKREKIRR
jgi:hypothetical protein